MNVALAILSLLLALGAAKAGVPKVPAAVSAAASAAVPTPTPTPAPRVMYDIIGAGGPTH